MDCEIIENERQLVQSYCTFCRKPGFEDSKDFSCTVSYDPSEPAMHVLTKGIDCVATWHYQERAEIIERDDSYVA